MTLQMFETAIREVAFWAVLAMGCLCLLGGVAAIGAWALKALLKTLSLYRDFAAFVRGRKRGR